LLAGFTSGKEYAELEWPIDIAIAVVWVAFAINFLGTLVRRRERHMYVALWFHIATVVTIAVLHIFNSWRYRPVGSRATRCTRGSRMRSCSGGTATTRSVFC
jgi:cbb3-type cytochrome oxidase subunit 1